MYKKVSFFFFGYTLSPLIGLTEFKITIKKKLSYIDNLGLPSVAWSFKGVKFVNEYGKKVK